MLRNAFQMVAIACIGLSGCATVSTQPMASDDKGGPGIAYFLPRQLAQVTVTRIKRDEAPPPPKPLSDAIKAQAEAQKAVDAAKASVGAADAALRLAEDTLIAASNTTAGGLDILNARLKTRQKELVSANGELDKAKKELNSKTNVVINIKTKAMKEGRRTEVTESPSKTDYTAVVEIKLLPPSADPAHGLRLNTSHNIFRDDSNHLVISNEGLLTSNDTTAIDRTGEIIVAMSKAVGAVAELNTGVSAPVNLKSNTVDKAKSEEAKQVEPKPDECKNVPDKRILIVDFAAKDDVETQANKMLTCMGVRFERLKPNFSFDFDAGAATGNNSNLGGIAYRTPIEQWIKIQVCAKDYVKDCDPTDSAKVDTPPDPTWRTAQVVALKLPQAGPVSYLPQNAGAFTKTTYKTRFQDGILIDYDAARPSEVAEVASWPIRVIDGVFEGVSKVISLRTNVAKQKAELATEQKGQLEAQYNLLAAQVKSSGTITAAEKANLEAQIALAKLQLSGQTDLATAQASLAQQQTNLLIAQANAPTQILTNSIANTIQSLKDQAKLNEIRACILKQTALGESVDPCFK